MASYVLWRNPEKVRAARQVAIARAALGLAAHG
jgi:hypothetical protein